MKFVFLHIPKTAGTSLKAALEQRVGKANIAADYLRPFAEPAGQRNRNAAWYAATHRPPTQPYVYGHFVALKYFRLTPIGFRPYPGVQYATFVRDPLARAVSHYVHWKNFPQRMHAKWLEFDRDQWTLERFLMDPFFTDFHHQILYGSRLRDYAVVGVLERMEESMALFGRTFPEFADLAVPQLRVSPHNKPEIHAELDPAVVARF